jgi:phosphomannomutase
VRALEREFGPHRYARLDVPMAPADAAAIVARIRRAPPARLLGRPVTEVCDLDGVKCVNRDGAWLMWRASGTEPLLRIYAEAASTAEVRRLLDAGRRRLARG